MSRSPCCGEGSGTCEKPENSQEVTFFFRLTPQLAFKEVGTQEIGGLWFYIHCENMNMFYKGEGLVVLSMMQENTAAK